MVSKNGLFLIFFVLGALLVRTLWFNHYLNFSTDQALFSDKALEIWRNKSIVLIGPSISFHYIGRDFYQGSITYYFQLIFLLLGKFNPIVSSYLFTVFASFMIIPLYYGVKLLNNQKSALVISALYAFFPLYVDHTRFFWNPNFQLSLLPLLILTMGFYEKKKTPLLFFLIGLISGALLLFHYQFIVCIVGLLIYYFCFKKVVGKFSIVYLGGMFVGFSPLIIFEVRNQFYNTQTLFLYITHLKEIVMNDGSSSISPHYFLSISLLLIIFLLFFISKKISLFHTLLFAGLLFMGSFFYYAKMPDRSFGMKNNWNYLDEERTHSFIVHEGLHNYNVANLGYDTMATVQKFLLNRDGSTEHFDDYYHNKYLFIISDTSHYMKNPAYEVNTFKPSKIIKIWKINTMYSLYLLQRISS